MSSTSYTRWRTAQNVEKRAFHNRKEKTRPTESHFFSQNFILGSKFFNDKNILEVGCSPTAVIHSLKSARFRVGIDPLAGKWARFYANSTDHIQGMGEYLPFKDKSFDIILCINVLDHVQMPSVALKEIRRCLKKGGTLVLWLQTFSTSKIIRSVLNLIDAPHPHHFRDSDISFMLMEIGYGIDYHQCRRASFNSAISVIKEGLTISGLKSLFANLFLGLHESSYKCAIRA